MNIVTMPLKQFDELQEVRNTYVANSYRNGRLTMVVMRGSNMIFVTQLALRSRSLKRVAKTSTSSTMVSFTEFACPV